MIVLHMDIANVTDWMNGTHYDIPAGEPYEIASDFDAGVLMKNKHWSGIVEVTTHRSKAGITYDVDDAMARAQALWLEKSKECIQQWTEGQFADRVNTGKNVLPPRGRTEQLIQAMKVNLEEDYAIKVPSMNAAKANREADEAKLAMEHRQTMLEAKLELLLQQNAALIAASQAHNQPQARAAK